jgi:CMP/dCMP kinase
LKVAIDGPAGAGKSTVARQVAARLGFVYLDSGAMYRCVALASCRLEISPDDAEALGALAESIEIAFFPHDSGRQDTFLNGEDVSGVIRIPEISALASQVSVHPRVRTAMVALQRELGAKASCVMEGRDIGTVVFPDAELKIFLTASAEVRADRRVLDLHTRGIAAERATVLREIIERDRRDETRETSPLIRATDAVEVQTDGMTPSEVVDRLVTLARERGA